MSGELGSIDDYIREFDIASCSCRVHGKNVIIFTGEELSHIIFPGLFHELSTIGSSPDFFAGTKSSVSRYQLPSHISAPALLDEIRSALSNALLFIHSWMSENSPRRYKELLGAEFATYQEFFSDAFSMISDEELSVNVRDMTDSIRSSVEKISCYLGPYHGSLSNCVHKNKDISSVFIILSYVLLLAYVLHQNLVLNNNPPSNNNQH